MKYCLITDRKLYSQPLWEVAVAAEAEGVDYFQLREKDLSPRELLDLAKRIRRVLKRTILIVNSALDVALASSADGVHLQKDNIPVEAVHSRYSSLEIGYSAHSPDEIHTALKNGAAYVFISPVFDPKSKSATVPSLGIAQLASLSAFTPPVFALGGVSRENIPELILAGCTAVAGISLFIENGKFSSKGMVA